MPCFNISWVRLFLFHIFGGNTKSLFSFQFFFFSSLVSLGCACVSMHFVNGLLSALLQISCIVMSHVLCRVSYRIFFLGVGKMCMRLVSHLS